MMKFKPNQTRTYDGEGFKRRAACLCFKNEKEDEVLLVSSSRHPDQWIVPGGGMEPEEEPCGAAVREVYEEDWEDSLKIGRKRKWFKIDEAIRVLQGHKPVHAEYLRRLTSTCNPPCSPTNGNTLVPPVADDNSPHYVTTTQGSGLVTR
ncbi:nudix (nucleoside diphosphate linked moiety X)-type motif 4a isoform X3 [Osmerus eperlanus]|uniref:nudix (nucleoside diphosphate linked moiety X)-type motif 4a isoform X3 n=1 Tax=Osmerus eperlanus TaxID=29151 RepID=UPI002E0F7712